MIEIKNLQKSFGSKQVLRGVDLNIQEGMTNVIIGASGCGKSVLLKHIVGLLKPDEGHILIDGDDITTMNEKECMPSGKSSASYSRARRCSIL